MGTVSDNTAQPSIKVPGNVATITILENDNARGMVQFNVNTVSHVFVLGASAPLSINPCEG